MPTALEWLEFFYPALHQPENMQYASPQDITMAMAVANDFRPKCLGDEQQNQAQAHYAAYVLEFRRRAQAAGLSSSEIATATVSGPIVEKQEGTTRVRYSEKLTTGSTSVSLTSLQGTLTGPGTAYAAWFALSSLCSGVDMSTGQVIRRGGIITRFGLPK